MTFRGVLLDEDHQQPAPRPRRGALEDFRKRFRSETRNAGSWASTGVPGASAYCFDVVAEAGGELLSFLSSVARVLVGYSCYDNGHPFTRRE